MHAESNMVQTGDPFLKLFDEIAKFVGNGIADRVRDIDNGGAGLDRGIDDPTKVVKIRT